MRETKKYIFFWGSYLSNFAETEFVYNNIKFYSSEQFFMYKKALTFNDIEIANKILKENKPAICKKLGRKIKNFDENEWSNKRYEIMIEALILKFEQNLEFKKLLLDTKDKILVEASPYDKIWGIGLHYDDNDVLDEKQWKGLNLLGKALMEVREKLRN